MAAKKKQLYTVPNQHEFEGIQFGTAFKADILERVKSFKVTPQDTMIVGFPKSGTTWMQEILWLIQNNVDTEAAKKESVWTRVPTVALQPPNQPAGIDLLEKMAPPRLMKSHLPVQFWKEKIKVGKPKVVYIIRNGKDSLVSFYYFMKHMHDIPVSFDDLFELFRENKMFFGGMLDHIYGWWTEFSESRQVLFVKYEECKKDAKATIQKIASFLEKELTEEQVNIIADFTSFQKMKENTATNLSDWKFLKLKEKGASFQRKGIVGGWREYFSKDQSDFFDKRVEERFAGTGLSFEYELYN